MVVAGGGALLPGLCARLAQEIEALATTAPDTDPSGGDAAPVGSSSGGGYSWARACVTGHEEPGSSSSSSSYGDAGGGNAQTSAGGEKEKEDSGSGSGEQKERAGRTGLCVVKVPVRRDLLVWTGASIMASLTGGIAQRCLTSEQYLSRAAAAEGGGPVGGGGGGRLPDWMSVSPADWVFEAAVATV